MRHLFKQALFAAALATASLNASAQAGFSLELESIPTVIGAGVGSVPDYKGSSNNTWGIAPYFRHQFAGERYIQLNVTELSLNVLNDRMFRFGPVINYHFGRDDDVDDPLVARMREIEGTLEAGVFGEVAWVDRGNPRNRFILGATVLFDTGNEYDGWRARVSARYWQQVAQAIDLHIGAGLWYGDGKYNNTYFGVNPANRGLSGLRFYDAGSGVNEYFLTLGGVMYFSREWVGMAGLRLSQISGDAKDSPVVADRGDKSQFIGGIGVGYMWR